MSRPVSPKPQEEEEEITHEGLLRGLNISAATKYSYVICYIYSIKEMEQGCFCLANLHIILYIVYIFYPHNTHKLLIFLENPLRDVNEILLIFH